MKKVLKLVLLRVEIIKIKIICSFKLNYPAFMWKEISIPINSTTYILFGQQNLSIGRNLREKSIFSMEIISDNLRKY